MSAALPTQTPSLVFPAYDVMFHDNFINVTVEICEDIETEIIHPQYLHDFAKRIGASNAPLTTDPNEIRKLLNKVDSRVQFLDEENMTYYIQYFQDVAKTAFYFYQQNAKQHGAALTVTVKPVTSTVQELVK